MLTDLVGTQQWPVGDVDRAARLALELASRWELDGFGIRIVRSNAAESYLDAGLVEKAVVVLGDLSDEVAGDDGGRQLLRARINTVRGRFDTAAALLDALAELPPVDPAPSDLVRAVAELEIWRGEPGPAAGRLAEFLTGELDGDTAPRITVHVLLLARAEADQVDVARDDVDVRRRSAARLREMVRQLPADPFGGQISPVPRKACQRMWRAELARLEGIGTTDQWAAVAADWSSACRPHHAAYCRWRAAQIAMVEGQATVAARLLRRAARDAREHVPLSDAIAATARGR